MFKSVEELAAAIDFTMLRPDLTEQQVIENCQHARQAGFASVTVRPSDIDAAVRALASSSTRPGTVAGFPHGDSTTATKLYEVRELLRRGAREIDAVVNIAKLLSRQFQYVESEIQQISESCRKEGAISKIIFENCYLTEELKIILCRICSRAEVNLVVTSTNFSPGGYTLPDLTLMRKYLPEDTGIKAGSGVRSLDEAVAVIETGCTRIGLTQPARIVEEFQARLEVPAPEALPT